MERLVLVWIVCTLGAGCSLWLDLEDEQARDAGAAEDAAQPPR